MAKRGIMSAWCLAGLLCCGIAAGDPQPATLEQLQDFYPKVADNANAALVYLQATDARVMRNESFDLPILGGNKLLDIPAAPLGAQVKAGFAAELEANAETLRLLHQAGAMPQCRYPIDLTQGQAVQLSHLAKLRDFCRLLSAQAVAAAEDQHAGLAVQSVLDMGAVAESVRNEPLMVSQLVRMACWGLTIDAMEQVVNRVPLDEGALLQFEKTLARASERNAITRALQGELCVCKNTGTETPEERSAREQALSEYMEKQRAKAEEEALRESAQESSGTAEASGGDMEGEVPPVEGSQGGQGAVQAPPPELQERKMGSDEQVEIIKELQKLIQAARLPYFDALKRFPPLPDPGKTMREESSKEIREGRGRFRPYQRTIVASARLASKAAAAQGCIAFERYRLKNGKLPDKWEDLVPGILPAPIQDPFTKDSPLLFRVKDNGYVVYSVGDNGKDDGGEKGDGHRSPDLCFRKMDMLKDELNTEEDRNLRRHPGRHTMPGPDGAASL